MTQHHDPFNDNDWTPAERAMFDALRAERTPSPELKQRTIAALERRGLLRRTRSVSPTTIVAVLLAASVVFIAGAIAGYTTAEHRARIQAEEHQPSVRDVARIDSVPATSTTSARHVVWF